MDDKPDRKRAAIVLAALFLGGAVPIQLVTLSFGYAQLYRKVSIGPKVILTGHEFASTYIQFAYIPAIVALVGLFLYCRKHYPDVSRRIAVGLAYGAVATIALDSFRQMGVINGWLPGDTPEMFGKLATGSSVFSVYYPVGLFVHFFNGASFGLFYAFVWGKRKSYGSAVLWATVWALLLEIGMMTGPPMGPMVGPFGIRYAWPSLFLITLVAHIAFGVTLGLLVQHFLKEKDRGGLLTFLKGQRHDGSSP